MRADHDRLTPGAPPVHEPDAENHGTRAGPETPGSVRRVGTIRPAWKAYGATLLVVAGCTAVAGFMEPHFDPGNLTMIYLLGVVVIWLGPETRGRPLPE